MPRPIAVAQTVPVRGDVAANLEAHLRLARAAGEARAQLVLFPELSLTGYELELAEALAFTTDDARLRPLSEAAARLELTLVAGAPVRLDGALHIGALIVEPSGAIGLYTKRKLGAFPPEVNPGGAVPPPEASVFRPRDLDPPVAIEGGAAAIAICADIGDPAHAERAAARGAAVYLASMFVILADHPAETAGLAHYARRHAMAVAFANLGGPSGGLPSAGRSAFWSERGERVVELPASGEGLALATCAEAGWIGVALPG